jgi:alkylated DNA repair dioxygenase AlkB
MSSERAKRAKRNRINRQQRQQRVKQNPGRIIWQSQQKQAKSQILHFPAWETQHEQEITKQALLKEILFPQDRAIAVRGPNVPEPRDVVFQGKPDVANFSYSQIKRKPEPFTPQVEVLRKRIEQFIKDHELTSPHLPDNFHLNCTLINRYQSGQDSIGKHSDDELDLGAYPVVASLSVGTSRDLVFTKKNTKPAQKLVVKLQGGDLLLMMGPQVQEKFKHSVPKNYNEAEWRISLNYRHHFTAKEKELARELISAAKKLIKKKSKKERAKKQIVTLVGKYRQ